jgi:hypothetical protein
MQTDTSGIAIEKPNIRDTDGTLIHPKDYEAKLKDGAYVAVEVLFKV